MKHVKIPENWSGDEALTVVTFLEDVIRAVWRAYGGRIFDDLMPPLEEVTDFSDPFCLPDDEAQEENLPF